MNLAGKFSGLAPAGFKIFQNNSFGHKLQADILYNLLLFSFRGLIHEFLRAKFEAKRSWESRLFVHIDELNQSCLCNSICSIVQIMEKKCASSNNNNTKASSRCTGSLPL